MLIPFDWLVSEFDIQINGIVHAGASVGQEVGGYEALGVENVLWIEGNPKLIPELKRNVAQGHEVVCALVGSEVGQEVDFNIANYDQSSSVLPLGTHLDVHPWVSYVDTIRAETTTIDTIVANSAHGADANFLNLDLQGYELEALKGATRTLEHVDCIYSEVNVRELYVGCALLHELNDFLEARGFELVALKMAGDVGWGDGLFRRTTL